MSVTVDKIKNLRERTGAGMLECKKALTEVNGDIEKAIELMRKSGQAKAAKKAGRIAAEGVVVIKMSDDNKTAFMVEINTETDFAARDENFKKFVDKVVSCGLWHETVDLPALLAAPIVIGGQAVAQECESLIAKIGENIQIRKVALMKSEGIIGAYSHGTKIGVLVELSIDDLLLGKDIAMHIAASKPEVVAPEDLSADSIDKEKQIYLAQAATTGKPEAIIEKIVAGQIKKFMQEVSLINQPFVKDTNVSVGDLLKDKDAKVLSFVRFEVGEGIEKQVVDFAAEVKAQAER